MTIIWIIILIMYIWIDRLGAGCKVESFPSERMGKFSRQAFKES